MEGDIREAFFSSVSWYFLEDVQIAERVYSSTTKWDIFSETFASSLMAITLTTAQMVVVTEWWFLVKAGCK